MTLKEFLELSKEEKCKYILEAKTCIPHNIYQLVDYVEDMYKHTTILSAIETDQRLLGWYEGQASAYKSILDILQDLGLKTKTLGEIFANSPSTVSKSATDTDDRF